MFEFLVTAEGGLTGAGYIVCIVAGIVLFALALLFAGKSSEKRKISTKQLVFCGIAMALAFVTSYIKIFEMPWGGSVTLCSMTFVHNDRKFVQHAFYCADSKLVWGKDRNFRRTGIQYPAVYSGAVCPFIFSGVLRLFSGVCGSWHCRLFC